MNIEMRSMTGLGPQAWDHDYSPLVIPSLNHHREHNNRNTPHNGQSRSPPPHNPGNPSAGPSASGTSTSQSGSGRADTCTIAGAGCTEKGPLGGCAVQTENTLAKHQTEHPTVMTRQMLTMVHPLSEYRYMLFTRELWRFWINKTFHTHRCVACEIVLLCILTPLCVAGTAFTLCADAFGFTMPG